MVRFMSGMRNWARTNDAAICRVLLCFVMVTYVGQLTLLGLFRPVWWQLIVTFAMALTVSFALISQIVGFTQHPAHKQSVANHVYKNNSPRLYHAIWTSSFWTPAVIQFLCVVSVITCVTLLAGNITHYNMTKATRLPFGCANDEVAFYDFDAVHVVRCYNYFLQAQVSGALLLLNILLATSLITLRYTIVEPFSASETSAASQPQSGPPTSPLVDAPAQTRCTSDARLTPQNEVERNALPGQQPPSVKPLELQNPNVVASGRL